MDNFDRFELAVRLFKSNPTPEYAIEAVRAGALFLTKDDFSVLIRLLSDRVSLESLKNRAAKVQIKLKE